MKKVKIVSYNVNGIRSAMNKGFNEWVDNTNADIICLQEVKAEEDQVDLDEMKAMGYEIFWHSAQKKGYSGVAIFTKIKPDHVVIGSGMEQYDNEGRILRLDFGDVTLLNCYFPSGSAGEERQAFKMVFLHDFYNWIQELKKQRPNIIVVGDYNIAHAEIDIHNPKGNKNSSGFLPEERDWMTHWLENGQFVDTFRSKNPELQKYSWWSFRFNSRASNKGWRIDYQTVSKTIEERVLNVGIDNDALHSDHCPVWLEVKI
jgi:exodeoxyribonuclease III